MIDHDAALQFARDFNPKWAICRAYMDLRTQIEALKLVRDAAEALMPFQPDLPGSKYEHPAAVNNLRKALEAAKVIDAK